jgi:hypothetical protein
MPLPHLLYAQVIKTTRRRRLVQVSHRVVFGTLDRVNQVLAAHGWQINTAFMERINLDLRQHVAAVGRRVTTLCKHEDGIRQQLALYQVYHNPELAAADTSDGCGTDGSCVEPARSAVVSGATVATALSPVRGR